MAERELEETFKHGDDAFNMREDVRKRRQECHSLNGRTSLAELYVEGEIRVHLHMCVAARLDEGEIGDWCAVFEARPCVDIHVLRHESLHVTESKPLETQDGADRLDDSVFVGVVNVLEQPQEVGFRLIPSTIRLQPFDECFLTRRKVLDESPPIVPILITSGKDGKGRSVVGSGGLKERQLPNDLVESRAQVVGDVPDDDAPLLRRGCVNLSPQNALVCISVIVRENSVGVSLKEPLNLFLKGFEVHIRPTNLEPGSV